MVEPLKLEIVAKYGSGLDGFISIAENYYPDSAIVQLIAMKTELNNKEFALVYHSCKLASCVVYAPEEHCYGDNEAMADVLDQNLFSSYNNVKKEALATILSWNKEKEKEKEVIRLDEEEDEQQNRVSIGGGFRSNKFD
ncbi:hypothetical protein ACLB2K_006329 [Fragaria x ananassa]